MEVFAAIVITIFSYIIAIRYGILLGCVAYVLLLAVAKKILD